MSIDLTTLITNLQADVDAVDSSTSMSSILSLMHKARKITSISNYYDSAGLLPVDSSYDGMLAFSKADNTVYKFVDSGLDAGTVQGWHKADSAFSSGGGDTFAIAGSTYGYSSGGEDIKISRWSFASDGDAIEQGDLISNSPVRGGAGKSASKGYRAGGFHAVPLAITTAVQSWPFSATGNAVTEPATLTQTRYNMQSGPIQPSTGDFVFNYGGQAPPTVNTVDKYPIAADATGADVGDLDATQYYVSGSPSGADGYINGRQSPNPTSPTTNQDIKKFPFASYSISDIGYNVLQLNTGGGYSAATHSPTHSYQMGGRNPTSAVNIIGKYPFSADADATDVGDLTTIRQNASGAASATHGYTAGGRVLPPGSPLNIIDKFPFSSDGNATDVGDLTNSGQYPSEGMEK